MKGYSVYIAIQQLKEQGFKKAAVARKLDVNRRTVDRYWCMSVDEYEYICSSVRRKQALDKYQKVILGWLRDHPSMSSAQICDWLKEHYEDDFSERTVSRYVKELREKYDIKKITSPRTYEAVAELPAGQQMQVDFGEMYMSNSSGGRTKVYILTFVLSHSRYKYAEIQSRPITSVDLVRACHRCFNYIGGIPKEIVFDQDSIVCVSENTGDIIYTYEFEKFRQDTGMSIYMCRGADPESKGKIENVVKYVKGNFLNHRIYIDDESLNISCIKWLKRTANAKENGTTKKIPAEVFKTERDYLKPVPQNIYAPETKIYRTVRKDNTIIYNSNRYSVPFHTYNNHKEVRVYVENGMLRIFTIDETFICEHKICSLRGCLIQNSDHKRDKSSGVDQIQKKLDERLDYRCTDFLNAIRHEKQRYARDQFKLINTLLDNYDKEKCIDAIEFCIRSRLFSANMMKDYLEHHRTLSVAEPEINMSMIPIDDAKYHISTEKRPLDVYVKVGDQYVDSYR